MRNWIRRSKRWAPRQREAFQLNGSRIVTLYGSGQVEAGIAAAQELVKRQSARTGDKSFDTAAARGILAIGYAAAARDADAVREFKASIPIVLAAARENADDDDATVVAARSVRLQRIVEAYIAVLPRTPNMSDDVAVETFGLADAVRGQAVQKALADFERARGRQGSRASLNSSAPSKISPNKSTPSSAHLTISSPCRRRNAMTAACARSPPRSKSCAQTAKPRDWRSTGAFRPTPAWSIRSRQRSVRSRQRCGPAKHCSRFTSARTPVLCGLSPRTGQSPFRRCPRRRSISKPRSAGSARRSSRRSRW